MSKTVIGITGGIACGKSTVTSYLVKHGYDVSDADKIAHSAYLLGSPCYSLIMAEFGTVSRHQIGHIVFHDDEERKKLESIIHPYVKEKMRQHIANTSHALIFLDVPLLFEAGFDSLCDKVICVYCDREIQISRLMKRSHINRDEAIKRIGTQMDLEEKKRLSDYLIDNNGDQRQLAEAIENILEEVRKDGALPH